MLLTCPQCRSGLQVPDGTTAMVRCPACKAVFSPAEGAAPEPEEDDEEPKPKPRKKGGSKERDAKARDAKAPKEENRDFEPVAEEDDRKRRRKRPRGDAEEGLTPAEKAARKAAFQRAAIGAKLIWVSFGLFMLSMVLILAFFFQTVLVAPIPYFITLAGVIGLLNWLLAAVGVGLCLSGPRVPGHWGYGIAAAVTTGLHLLLLMVLVVQAKDVAIGQTGDNRLVEAVRWGQLPTRMDATMMYLTVVCYRDMFAGLPKGTMLLPMITGLVEMVRAVLIMMLLSCLSRAALDEELAYRCTRAGGIASLGPGLLALAMIALVATLVETNATGGMFVAILLLVAMMGTYAVLMGTMFPAFVVARDVADACDEPFQSLIPQL